MRNIIHLKFFARMLLVVMLTVTIHCVHENAHAMQKHVSVTGDHDVSAPHHCPCAPHEQQADHDDCDSCCNCACHSTLTIQPLQLSYDPFILELSTFDRFRHIPEVYLPKFIPPQIRA